MAFINQTTLTNFERTVFRGRATRFLYEEQSFQPHRFEMLGFGPSAITFTADGPFQNGLKSLNPDRAEEYTKQVQAKQRISDRGFGYQPHDLKIFYLTRRLAALEIDRPEYRTLFGADPLQDCPAEFAALFASNLIDITQSSIRPTAWGMFYADSIAALLAEHRLNFLRHQALKARPRPNPASLSDDASLDNTNGHGHM